MFYTGTHRGKTGTEADLHTMVKNFSAPKGDRDWEAPVQLDHSESARDMVGNIRRVWRAIQRLKY